MHPFDRPIVKTGHSQGAAVANSLTQHLPCVAQIVAVRPYDLSHVAKMMRLRLAKAERNSSLDLISPRSLNAVRHGYFSFYQSSPAAALSMNSAPASLVFC